MNEQGSPTNTPREKSSSDSAQDIEARIDHARMQFDAAIGNPGQLSLFPIWIFQRSCLPSGGSIWNPEELTAGA